MFFPSRRVWLASAALLLLAPSAMRAAEPSRPGWWTDYHTLVSWSTQKEKQIDLLAMMAERGGLALGWYGAWWTQQEIERLGPYDALKHVERFRAAGVKNVFYFDAGEMGEFVALVSPDGRLLRSQWELPFYRGEKGRLMWFGIDAFYRDNNPLRLKNYRQCGLQPWTLPDGRRVASVYELAHVNYDGRLQPWEYHQIRVPLEIAKALDLDTFLAAGPDPVPADAAGSLGRIRSFDHSNPRLLEDFEANLAMMLPLKPAFLHFDNYFDNELIYPHMQGFGPWSLANFQRFLGRRVNAEQRRALGVSDTARFDLRRYIAEKPFPRRGTRAHFFDKRWEDDPLWNVYVCSKLADSQALFRGLYDYCKTTSRRHGAEVVVAGNTIPTFPGESLVTGAIDQVHFEYHVAGQYGPIRVPLGLPPEGKLGGVTRLAAALGSTGYCWPTVYVPQDRSGPGHENLHKVLAFDCLANRGVLDYNYQYKLGYSPGSDESAAWINHFIRNYAAEFGRRRPRAQVGLVFPGESLLGSIHVFSMDPEPCLYDYLGWSLGLTEQHVAWDALADDQLRSDALGRFAAVILPSAACLSQEALDALAGYLRAGGRVIASGEPGTRFGVDGLLWHRPAENTLRARLVPSTRAGEPLTEAAVGRGRLLISAATPGKEHYLDRHQGIQAMAKLLARGLENLPPTVTTTAGPTIGLTLFDEDDHRLAIDLVNYAVDAATDRLEAARDVKIRIFPPSGRHFAGPTARLRAPDLVQVQPAASPTAPAPWHYRDEALPLRVAPDGTAEITLPSLSVYAWLSLATGP